MLGRYKKDRTESMRHLGFGIEAMKMVKICIKCGKMNNVTETVCIDCGTQLHKDNLYEVYIKRHRQCKKCGTVVNNKVQFCPDCGTRFSEHKSRRKK